MPELTLLVFSAFYVYFHFYAPEFIHLNSFEEDIKFDYVCG